MVSQGMKEIIKSALVEKVASIAIEIQKLEDSLIDIRGYLGELGFNGKEFVQGTIDDILEKKGSKQEVIEDENITEPLNLVTRQPIFKKANVKKSSNTRLLTKVSKFKGVSKTTGDHWYVRLNYKNKSYNVGTYNSEIQAAEAYDDAKVKLSRSTSGLNFPERYKR